MKPEQARKILNECWRYMLRDNDLILTTGYSFDEILEALQIGVNALEREIQIEAHRECLNKYCENCQAYGDCNLIPICGEWMPVEESDN